MGGHKEARLLSKFKNPLEVICHEVNREHICVFLQSCLIAWV